MTSRLSKTKFESRLKNLTRKGEPTIMGTPFAIFTIFDFSGKPFYGEYSAHKFRLTRNKIFPAASGYTINGHFTESGMKTTVNYEIKPIPFSYYWTRITPIFGFLIFNGALLFSLKTFQWDLILTINGFIALITLLALVMDRFQRKAIEEIFIKAFEVES